MPEQINGVLLDFDDTVISEKEYFTQVVSSFFELDVEETGSLFQHFYEDRINRTDLLGYYIEALGFSREDHHDALFDHYSNYPGLLEPFEGVQEFIEIAVSNNLPLAILTNGITHVQRHKWEITKLNHKERIQFFPSREIGFDKPFPNTFEFVRKQLNLEWRQIFVAGDRLTDIEYPSSQGAISFRLGQGPSAGNFRFVQDFSQLTKIFKSSIESNA